MPKQDNEKLALEMQLPVDLGDGLLLRWAVSEDVAELSAFNVGVHSDDAGNPQLWLADYTQDLMKGRHPTTKASDFTVVVDQSAGSKIVSSLNLISQTWAYDGIPFGVGRIELVGTDPAYRRRGLVRHQMAAVHAKSAVRGELVQAITGIPWYYRQFGYEMTVNLSGSRSFFWTRPGNDKPLEKEIYNMRPAKRSDIPMLQKLYPRHSAGSLLVHLRSREIWEYELFIAARRTDGARDTQIIEDLDGAVIAYIQVDPRKSYFRVRELGVNEGHSWRAVALFTTRELKKRAEELNRDRDSPLTHIVFNMGETHPVYDALGTQLEKLEQPYTWYMRVPDLQAFLWLIKPVLEKRLGESVMAGYSGDLRLNMYRSAIQLTFSKGILDQVAAYKPRHFFDADAFFPDLSILQLIFCHRSFAELESIYADCFAEDPQAAVLLNCLFPKQVSDISPLE